MGSKSILGGNETIDTATLWQYIHAADQAGELICCDTPGQSHNQQSDGIPDAHAFTIFKVRWRGLGLGFRF
jgi:hypothetical protein